MSSRQPLLLAALALLLGACSRPGATATSQPPTATSASTPATATATATLPRPDQLTLWVPPFSAADVETEAGLLLAERLHAFEESHSGLTIDVRVKAERGSGGLLDSLTAAAAAAPASLPDLILLDPDSTRSAAAQGILTPLEGLISPPDSLDWYEYALPVTTDDGALIAYPVAAFTDVLAYRTDLYPNPPRSWDALLEVTRTLLFPAGDLRGRFSLAEYLSTGASLRDDSGNLVLDAALFSDVLDFYARAAEQGVITPAAMQFTRSEETWDEFRANRAASAAAPLTRFLAEYDPARMGAIPQPTRDGNGIAVATTWSWSLVGEDDQRSALAAELLDWLTAPDFLGEWTLAQRVLPTRSEVLAYWPDGGEVALVSSLVTAATPLPDEDVRTRLGLVMGNAVKQVLDEGLAPTSAAQAAIEALQSP